MKTDHNRLYATAQEDYLRICREAVGLAPEVVRKRCEKPLADMYRVAVAYFRNLTKQYAKGKGLWMDSENLEEKAHEMALYLIDQQLRHLGKKIDSLSAYGHWAKKKILFKDMEREMIEVQFPEESEGWFSTGRKDA